VSERTERPGPTTRSATALPVVVTEANRAQLMALYDEGLER
jgi:hypothetical protein